jgi:hypothetical protein
MYPCFTKKIVKYEIIVEKNNPRSPIYPKLNLIIFLSTKFVRTKPYPTKDNVIVRTSI